jgi:hypothetical protein
MKLPVLLSIALVSALASSDAAPAQEKGVTVKMDGLQSQAPATWKAEKPDFPSRLHQFRLSKTDGDAEDAEITISHFGQGQGGDLAGNLKRWKDQFTPPTGKSIEDVAKVEKLMLGSVEATQLDISGTYKSRNPPFDPNAKVELKPDWRLVAIFVPGKDAPHFIRFVGPAKTVEKHKKGFDDWVRAFK